MIAVKSEEIEALRLLSPLHRKLHGELKREKEEA
jgi:hypothetical protein